MLDRLAGRRVLLIADAPTPECVGSTASLRDASQALRELGAAPIVVSMDAGADRISTEIRRADLVLLTSHGLCGEDGSLSMLVRALGTACSGPASDVHAMCLNKVVFKVFAAAHGVRVPAGLTARPDTPGPHVVKPVSGGASIGVFLDSDGAGVQPLNDTVFAEKFIAGTLVTCAIFPVLDSDLPLLEIRHNGPILTNEAKRLSDACVEICPALISEPAEGRIRQVSRLLYEALHATGPIRFDYIVDSCGGEWLLEANSLPGFSRRSNLARITAKAGFSYEELIAVMAVQALDASAMMHKK